MHKPGDWTRFEHMYEILKQSIENCRRYILKKKSNEQTDRRTDDGRAETPPKRVDCNAKKKKRTEGTPFPIIISAYYTVYVETLLFGCCINTIFHMDKAVFHILWTLI